MPQRYIPATYNVTDGKMPLADDEMCRINADGSWSVRWDLVRLCAAHPPGLVADYAAPVAYAIASLLLAAKDNFHEASWRKADEIALKAGALLPPLPPLNVVGKQ